MREFFKLTAASALGNMIAWIALWFFLLSQNGCTIELFPIDFNTDVDVTMELQGFCETDDDCVAEYPFCLRLGEAGICVSCFDSSDCEEGKTCTIQLVCE